MDVQPNDVVLQSAAQLAESLVEALKKQHGANFMWGGGGPSSYDSPYSSADGGGGGLTASSSSLVQSPLTVTSKSTFGGSVSSHLRAPSILSQDAPPAEEASHASNSINTETKSQKRANGAATPTSATTVRAPSVMIEGKALVASSDTSPMSFLMENLRKWTPRECSPRTHPTLEVQNTFVSVTDEQKQTYNNEVVNAVYNQDIDALRRVHNQEGKSLQTSNQFGETLLHLACRRGYLDVVRFLVEETDHSLWVHDEQGKTPLHLACRSAKSGDMYRTSFALVNYILRMDHDMLFCADTRGHAPLDHVPRNQWKEWIDFLQTKNLQTLMPRRLLFFTKPAPTVKAPPRSLTRINHKAVAQVSATEGGQMNPKQPSSSSQPTAAPATILENIDFVIADYYNERQRLARQPRRQTRNQASKSSRRSRVMNNNSNSSSNNNNNNSTHSNRRTRPLTPTRKPPRPHSKHTRQQQQQQQQQRQSTDSCPSFSQDSDSDYAQNRSQQQPRGETTSEQQSSDRPSPSRHIRSVGAGDSDGGGSKQDKANNNNNNSKSSGGGAKLLQTQSSFESSASERSTRLKAELTSAIVAQLSQKGDVGSENKVGALKLLDGLNALDPAALLESLRLKQNVRVSIGNEANEVVELPFSQQQQQGGNSNDPAAAQKGKEEDDDDNDGGSQDSARWPTPASTLQRMQSSKANMEKALQAMNEAEREWMATKAVFERAQERLVGQRKAYSDLSKSCGDMENQIQHRQQKLSKLGRQVVSAQRRIEHDIQIERNNLDVV